MARVQIVMSDAERAAFKRQAELEGLSFSAWIRAAARSHCEDRNRQAKFESADDVRAFFARHESTLSPGSGPGWEEYKSIIEEPENATRVLE